MRNQLALWQGIGLESPPGFDAQLKAAIGHMAQAAISQDDLSVSTAAAQRAIAAAQEAMRVLVRGYVDQSLAARQRQNVKGQKALGVSLGRAVLKESVQRDIVSTFNAAMIPLPWKELEPREGKFDWTLADRQIEWCRLNNLRPFAGPVLQLDRASLPDWLYLWEGDFENLASLMVGQIKTVVNRYKGKVALWTCSAGLNTAEAMSLSEEERLRLAVMSVEATRETDARAAVVLAIDQPWGEFMGRQPCDFSPLHFADALGAARSGSPVFVST